MRNPTQSSRSGKSKSKKPYDGFPLTAHPTGRWCKKHKGRTFYFGPLDDWKSALEKYERDWRYIVEGKTPPGAPGEDGDACTLRALCNAFLESRRNRMHSGELTPRSYRDYFRTCERMIAYWGREQRVDDLKPLDFERFRSHLASTLNVVSLKNEINRCRVVFSYASRAKLVPQPIDYGDGFNRPSAKVLRRANDQAGAKRFTRDELLTILDALDGHSVTVDGEQVTLKPHPQMKAMVLLGLNGAMGNTDCANLRESHVNLETGWIDFPRVKTDVPRRFPLWPETVKALRIMLGCRKRAREAADADLLFLTRTRRKWVRMTSSDEPEKSTPLDMIGKEFSALLKKLKINGRSGLGFYTLRRQFEIKGGESRDQIAVDLVMGHTSAPDDMAAIYRQNQISDQRLRDVVEHVRCWLWPEKIPENNSSQSIYRPASLI